MLPILKGLKFCWPEKRYVKKGFVRFSVELSVASANKFRDDNVC